MQITYKAMSKLEKLLYDHKEVPIDMVHCNLEGEWEELRQSAEDMPSFREDGNDWFVVHDIIFYNYPE